MTAHSLSQVRNFRECNSGVPRSLEIEAIIDTVTEGWDYGCVKATHATGVADTDRDAIAEIIGAENLSVTQAEAEQALREWCAGRVEA